MSGFAGFDRSDYPGLPVMDWLRANTNLAWCAFYLGPAPSHGDASWMSALPDLTAWGVAPVYVGQEVIGPGSHNVTAAQGAIDGEHACELMAQAGFARGRFVFLDLENGTPFTAAQQAYVGAWCDAVVAGGYGPGVYCSFLFAKQVAALRPNARMWVFHVRTVTPHEVPGEVFANPDPATSGFAGAAIWQHDDEAEIPCAIVVGGRLVVDLDSAATNDPGAP